jgi:hypothetical protein
VSPTRTVPGGSAFGVDEVTDRVDRGEALQPAGHGLHGHEDVAREGERQDDDRAQALNGLGDRDEEGEQDPDPRQSQREAQSEADSGEDLQRSGIESDAEEQPEHEARSEGGALPSTSLPMAPTSGAARRSGRLRKRSNNPLDRSLLRETPTSIVANKVAIATMPGKTYCR